MATKKVVKKKKVEMLKPKVEHEAQPEAKVAKVKVEKPITVSRLEIKAVIPTRQYENIQPLIEMKDVDLQKGTELAMAHINKMAETYSEHGGFKVREQAKQATIEVKTVSTVKLQSFNEKGVDVDFDPIAHTYHYKGKELRSASNLTKSFYKPFEAEKIAGMCEKAWGVPAKDILALWESNKEIASEFGTLVHKALEHSEVQGGVGVKISEKKKDGSNPAILKHPILRGIVNDFNTMYEKTGVKGKALTEVFITDIKNGICGQADRVLPIIGKDKRVRIQDYKVNVDAEKIDKTAKPLAPFADLPSTKLTKYRIQMSIYGNMLQNTGFEVVGLDAFVLEEEWKHFELDVLDVIK